MAHIPDGILSAPVLIGGTALALGGLALGLRALDDRTIPKTAILAAGFFAGSLLAIPVGPSSVHLLFGGLMGLMLGMAVFPALVVALLLQALLFGMGGLTTLGVNTLNMALPGVALAMLVGPILRATGSASLRALLAALAGALAVFGTGGMVALSLFLSSSDYVPVASVLLATYLPLALVEAFVTAATVGFLVRVRPDALLPVLP
ncbi:MAG: cobalt transporter CbiM [Alphaproteobacteria bacterium]|nr:cobalt transporter CbiM [Alphaproteobacteria bacterium]